MLADAVVSGIERRPGRRRLLWVAATGLVVGVTIGFLGALVRPRSWIEYDQPRGAM